MRRHIAKYFDDKVFYGGLTYNSHPMGCATALATIRVYEEDNLIENARKMGAIMKTRGGVAGETPVGGRGASIGLFGIVELIRDRQTRQPMARLTDVGGDGCAGEVFPGERLYTIVRWNSFYTIHRCALTSSNCGRRSRLLIKGWRLRIGGEGVGAHFTCVERESRLPSNPAFTRSGGSHGHG